MKVFADLRAQADARLLSGDGWGAVHAYAALLRLEPSDGDVRLRLADAFLAAGDVQRAAQVYTTVARHDGNAGYPLRALIALKVLAALEPQLEGLLVPFAALYASDSPRREGKIVRLAPPDAQALLPGGFILPATPPPDALAPAALQVATDLACVARYPETLPALPLLSSLPAEPFVAALKVVQLLRVRRGEVIVEEGSPGESFFVVARGAVEVWRTNPHATQAEGPRFRLATLCEGGVFGEMALVSASPRTATVVAASDADLLVFGRQALSAVAGHIDTIALALDRFARERLISNLLATAQLFKPLDRKQRQDLMRRFTAHDVPRDTVVIQEGTPGQGLYLLLHGQVRVEKSQASDQLELATLGPGDVFGEISLLQEAPTTASVIADRDSTVLFLSRDIFQRLVSAVPAIQDYVETLGSDRLLHTRSSLTDLEKAGDVEVLI